MTATLDGAGGASCHLCTSTREQLKDVDLVQHGFPINRFIDSALQIFEEVNEDEFSHYQARKNLVFHIDQHQKKTLYLLLLCMVTYEYLVGLCSSYTI